MTLRRKALLIIAVTLISLIGILYAVSRFVFIEGLSEIEELDVHKQVEQAAGVLSNELANLEANTANWSAWDNTYVFIESGDEEYIQSNLTDETFINLQLNLMLFIHSSGQVVFSKVFNLNDQEEVPISSSMRQYLLDDIFIPSSLVTENMRSGVILFDEGPMYIVAQPILTSHYEGPNRGILIMGRYLDSKVMEHLSQLMKFPITIHTIDDIRMQAEFEEALSSLSEEESVYLRTANTQYITGYTILKDVFGNPSLVLRMNIPREIYNRGLNAVYSYVLAAVLLGFTRLVKGVESIATGGSVTDRLPVIGTTELATIASTINGMLAALQESEDDLRNSESHYRLLAENVSDVIFTIDMDMKSNYISPSVINLIGYSNEEIPAVLQGEVLTSDSWDTAMKVYKEEMEIEETGPSDLARIRTIELEGKHRDGSLIWVEVNFSFIRDMSGLAIGIMGIARDITERRQASDELTRLYEHEKDLRQELEEEIHKRTEFSRALVHELKTPITPVLASSDLLVEELKDKALLGLAQNIKDGASNLNKRIDELLDLAKSEIGTLQLNISGTDPLNLLKEVVRGVIPMAMSYKQDIKIDLPDHLTTIWADADRLRQVVLNLLNNAFKFTSSGGTITIRAREDGINLIVEVQDTGRGISEEDRERLFEPYYRTEGDRARLSGLGLGLSLSKRIIELHGGLIWVESKKGKGSTFGFSIPLDSTIDKVKDVERG
jgi:PAS domain S-box-containing protein